MQITTSRQADLLRFLIKDLISDGWRTAMTVLNLLVFFSCFFCLTGLADAAEKFGNQPTDQSALLIMSRNVFDPAESSVTIADFAAAEEMIPEYVKSVTPLIVRTINVDDNILQLRAAGLMEMQTVHALQLVTGDWPGTSDEVLIGEGITNLTGWKPGDTVQIYGSNFMISGVVSAPGTKFSSLWMTLDTAINLYDIKDSYQFAWIQLQPEADGELVRAQLQADPRLNTRFEVLLADSLYQQYTEALKDLRNVGDVLVILALAAVMLGTYSSIFLILKERSREITILRAIGFQSRGIRLLIVVRTLLQVGAAYVGSWGLTTLVLIFFNRLNPLSLHSIPLPVVIAPGSFLLGFLLAILFSLIAVWIPTRHLRSSSVASFIHN